MTVRAAALRALGLAIAAGSFGFEVGCGDSYSAVIDSLPIALNRAPMGGGMGGNGALVAVAMEPDVSATSFPMLISTGTSMTLLQGPPPIGTPATEKVGFNLLDPMTALLYPTNPAVRGMFRGVSVLRLPLQAIGDGSVAPGGILGGDILRRYSVDLRFGAACGTDGMEICSTMTLWGHLGADLGFLEDAGYAVIRYALYGGGETTAEGDPDFLGQRGPLVLSPTRIVFRSCAVPGEFSPDLALEKMCCKEADAFQRAKGVDLALMLDTGVGPLVLAQSAWERVKAKLSSAPVEAPNGELLVAGWAVPIAATWSTLPKFALVDNETGAATDPGPCVELARARRIEQVSYHTVMGLTPDACTLPCDNDPREPDKSQNSAAYIELSGEIPVAVIADEEPYLQGLRFDVRPEGPELDGVLGAGALGRSRVEIDYTSAPTRAVFSCEPEAPSTACRATARCPRLPDRSFEHLCFGLKSHGLAPTCAPSGC
jgi:hypothetical protein